MRFSLRGLVVACLALAAFIAPAYAASLLPNGEQTFTDANGAPLVGGSVYFYIPGTTTPKDTWQDAGQTILNTNPVVLDSAGRAVIYGAGTYREIVKDAAGNTIWDQLTSDASAVAASWIGTTGGSANAQTGNAANFSSQDGQQVIFIAGFTNTGALTLTLNGGGPISVEKDTATGVAALTGGEIVTGNAYTALYDATAGIFHLASFPPSYASATFGTLNVTGTLTAGAATASVLTGTTTTVNGAMTYAGSLTPPTLAGNANNWTPNGLSAASWVRVSSSSAVNLTGIGGGADGRRITLVNVGSYPITLPSNSGSSLAANRFLFPGQVTLSPGGSLTLIYDGTAAGWRATALPTAAVGAVAIVEDQEAQNVSGGNSTTGVTTRTLNTVVADPSGIVTLAGNAFTLQPGGYLIRWRAPAYMTTSTSTISSLYNSTASQTVAWGESVAVVSGHATQFSSGSTVVTPTVATAYQIQQRFQNADTNGLGMPANLSGVEVYTHVEIVQLW